MITDCHIHIQPVEMFKPQALEMMKKKRPDFDQIVEFCRSPKAFLKFLDASGIDRAVLINYVAPEVIGFTNGVNQLVADYVKKDPKRLLSCGSLHPRHTTNVLADMEQILRLGIRMIKIHPPHQLLFPNDYLNGVKELEIIYRAAEANGVPVMFHTGTSIFPGARNKYGDPIYLDDVAVDFPKLKILLAHGGRPLWMQTAFFLVRRHPNVYLVQINIGMAPHQKECRLHPQRASAMSQQDLQLGEIDGHVVKVNGIAILVARTGKNRRPGVEHDRYTVCFGGPVYDLEFLCAARVV